MRWYNSRRYQVLATQLGRGKPTSDVRHGLLVIQIDGLGYAHLKEAMAQGYAPYLRHLVEREGCHLMEWRSGIPSTTPAVQAGIMYGNNWDIPSFRWYEKASDQSMEMKVPALARRLQRRIARGRTGLVSGGASYGNMMDGGARLTLLTVAALSTKRFFENVRGVGWLVLFLLNPIRLARILLISIWEYLRNVGERIASHFRPGRRRTLDVLSPFLQTLVNVVMQEVETFGVMLDMYVGMPSIYVNYLGYDEISHHEGPLHPESLRVLRSIDRRVREIDRARQQFSRRPYHFVILSDHGQSPSIPFSTLYGCTLGEYIRTQLGNHMVLDEHAEETPTRKIATQHLKDELDGVEANLSERGRRLLQTIRRYLNERLPPDPELGWDLERRGDIVVRSSGPLAHIYFNLTPHKMNVSETLIMYPELIRNLVDHPGIGLVIGQEGDKAVIATQRGVQQISESQFQPGHSLAGLSDPPYVIEQLARLLSFPHSGDLVILGAWNSKGEVICFEEQSATHGGIGGEQDRPFLLLPAGIRPPLDPIRSAEEVYPFLVRLAFPTLMLPAPRSESNEKDAKTVVTSLGAE